MLPYTFISPDSPHSRIRQYDYYMASFGLCKVIRREGGDENSPYRWLPKKFFHAVAEHYRRARRR